MAFPCPACGGAGHTVTTRTKPDHVRRQHKCQACGYEFNTVQVLAAPYQRVGDLVLPDTKEPHETS